MIYTEKDPNINREVLLKLKSKLEENNNYVFVDKIDNTSISHQQKWFQELVGADEIVIVKSPYLYKSRWVRQELEIAKLLGKQVKEVDAS